MTATFGARLSAQIARRGQLCVGIDPHEHLLTQWGLAVSAVGVREFGLRVVEAAAGRVGVVKPQVSFFERWGSAGFAALEEVLAAARSAGLLVIADVKRGDIGTTMDAYASAWLAPGSPLEADALTVSPYLGVGALESTFETAMRYGKGAFVLAATSNPEAFALQSPVAGLVAGAVQSAGGGSHAQDDGSLSSLGVVVGATVDRTQLRLDDRLLAGMPILAPGFGAQGAELPDLPRIFGTLAPQVLASESRGILVGGPDELIDRIEARSALLEGAVADG